eukprot:scpid23324/ scgid4914/ 
MSYQWSVGSGRCMCCLLQLFRTRRNAKVLSTSWYRRRIYCNSNHHHYSSQAVPKETWRAKDEKSEERTKGRSIARLSSATFRAVWTRNRLDSLERTSQKRINSCKSLMSSDTPAPVDPAMILRNVAACEGSTLPDRAMQNNQSRPVECRQDDTIAKLDNESGPSASSRGLGGTLVNAASCEEDTKSVPTIQEQGIQSISAVPELPKESAC